MDNIFYFDNSEYEWSNENKLLKLLKYGSSRMMKESLINSRHVLYITILT